MTVDRSWEHLWPNFRDRLRLTLTAARGATGHSWILIEGYRSQARQDWLWEQGRTRSGPIVTWVRRAHWHGAGLAADVAPVLNNGAWYQAPHHYWEALLTAGKVHGLANPAWDKGDLGHLQLTDEHERAQSLEWIARGFK